MFWSNLSGVETTSIINREFVKEPSSSYSFIKLSNCILWKKKKYQTFFLIKLILKWPIRKLISVLDCSKNPVFVSFSIQGFNFDMLLSYLYKELKSDLTGRFCTILRDCFFKLWEKSRNESTSYQSAWTLDFRLMLTLRNQLFLSADHDN